GGGERGGGGGRAGPHGAAPGTHGVGGAAGGGGGALRKKGPAEPRRRRDLPEEGGGRPRRERQRERPVPLHGQSPGTACRRVRDRKHGHIEQRHLPDLHGREPDHLGTRDDQGDHHGHPQR